jgi:8-oxo-dGTP pyrophosphatase MutT (NUDIX family)
MSLSESARALLTDWEPLDDDQRRLRDDFVGHLDTADDPWSRECLPDHLTASAIVVDHSRTNVLLALHRKVGMWLQFGGHIEPDDLSIADAAHREVLEESGLPDVTLVGKHPLRLDRHQAPCGRAARHHLDIQFLGLTHSSASPKASEESLDVRWFPVGALPTETDEAVRQLVAAAIGSTDLTG